ncbi:MAG: DUF4962 domain-containing protein [Candidatus Methylacidiphilales bacterium]|nr:DUF4962 domain-containing protein [Candidatus Methylacidiphilales bacterium]
MKFRFRSLTRVAGFLVIAGGLLSSLSFSMTARGQSASPFPAPAALPDALKLPEPVQKVVFREDLRSQHPRLFVDAAGVEKFRKSLSNPRVAELWTGFLRRADQIAAETPPVSPVSEDHVRGCADKLPRIAFAYLITQEPRYLEGARKWIRAFLSYPVWATDIDLGAAHSSFGMALCYDWLYSALSADERTQMETKLLRHGRLLLQRSVRYPNAWWGAAYFQNHCWINHTGISTAAIALYDTDPAEMQGWLNYTRTRFETTWHHLGIDSSYHEGPAYLGYGAIWALYYMESLRTVSGEDLVDMPMFRNLARHLVDVTMPDGRNIGNFGDTDAMTWCPLDDGIYTWLASRRKESLAEWQRQKGRAGFARPPAVDSPFAFLWFDPEVRPKAPEELQLPACGLYPDRGLVVFRSSWKDDAAVVSFLCGPPGGHHIVNKWATFPNAAPTFGHSHPDANSFLFFSDRQWRVGAPAGYTHDKQTHSENVWTVGGKGQRGGDRTWFEPASYFTSGIAQAHLVRVATSPAADYVIGEAAPAYEPEGKLKEFRRHLLFVKGDKPYIVVYDRLTASEPKTWASYMHTFGAIEIADGPSAPAISGPAIGSKVFHATGAAPFTETWAALSSLPELTPAHGIVFGPVGTSLATHPLNVLGHPKNKLEDRGFELVAQPPGSSVSTWLLTVIGVDKSVVSKATFTGSGPVESPLPALKVGNDDIAWDSQSGVSLNGKPIEGNLLPASK